MSCFGADGKPCLNVDKFAGWKSLFDERGNETSRAFFGADGKPCCSINRIAGWTATYDERGNQTSWSFRGIDGKPCLNINGIAGWKATSRPTGTGVKPVLSRHQGRGHYRPQAGLSSCRDEIRPEWKSSRSEILRLPRQAIQAASRPPGGAQEQAQK